MMPLKEMEGVRTSHTKTRKSLWKAPLLGGIMLASVSLPSIAHSISKSSLLYHTPHIQRINIGGPTWVVAKQRKIGNSYSYKKVAGTTEKKTPVEHARNGTGDLKYLVLGGLIILFPATFIVIGIREGLRGKSYGNWRDWESQSSEDREFMIQVGHLIDKQSHQEYKQSKW
jgi:hypothetical protein